ncbi:TPA: hypothetical protein QCY70_004937 [Bacillus cereus]|uniref:hypothetical protein n=1 Tax=Bacillus paranthracis TaxID=2026186 RepID=UPI0032F7387D|nr:hypothetical protein [Bacillus cereus]HDR8014969.1 hypothetical protein [Bacillus cereus]
MSTNLNAQFTDLNAATQFYSGGIEIDMFQTEITDLVRRAGVLGQRIQYVPATGSISNFFEQTTISEGQFSDPRNISASMTIPTRVQKSVMVKAITNRVDYGLFEMETVGQQGVFAQLKAKDLSDMVQGMLRLRDKGLWTGTDVVAGAQTGNGTTTQYVGLLKQITKSATIAKDASIVDGLRTEVAKLMADPNFELRPTAIYINPLALDYLEQEVKNSNNAVKFVSTDMATVGAGISVAGLQTAAGLLPIIPEPFLPVDASINGVAAAGAGLHNYPFAIVTEDLIEFHYVGSKAPRVFQLGTQANLQENYVGVMFGAPVAKAASQAHVVGAIVRA